MKVLIKGFIVLPIVISVFILGLVGYFVFKNTGSYKNGTTDELPQTAASSNKNTPTHAKSVTSLPQNELTEDMWYVQNDELGFSFQIPKDWEFVKAYGDDYSSYDIHGPAKDLLILISVHTDKRIGESLTLEDALKEREKQISSDESYKMVNLEKSVNVNEASYSIIGERLYFNFANENAWDEGDFVSYKLKEKGYFRLDKKVVILQSMVLPGNPNEKIAIRIIDSFKLK